MASTDLKLDTPSAVRITIILLSQKIVLLRNMAAEATSSTLLPRYCFDQGVLTRPPDGLSYQILSETVQMTAEAQRGILR